MGSGIGLALGAVYLTAGMAQAVSDHGRAARIAQAAHGAFSEAMLQREMDRLDPAALHLARAHDDFAADGDVASAQSWPSRLEDRQPLGRHGSALDATRQLDCLTQAVYFEARGETPRGQAAVAQVVMNRVNSPAFPKTVCGVVFQGAATRGCQFSFACDGSMRHRLETQAWDRSRQVAERTLSGVVAADIGRATHFHTTTVQPSWGPQMLRVAQVGLHVFYRLNPHAPLNRTDSRAVFVSLPLAPEAGGRMAKVVLEQAPEAVAAPPAGPLGAGKPIAPALEAPNAGAKAIDAVSVARPVDVAAS